MRRPLRRRLRPHRGAGRPRRGGDARPRDDRGADPLAGRWTTSRSPARSRAAARSTAEVAHRFIDAGLELGGKDPAYVCEDADFDFAVENVVDGAFYNAGQSCCGIERVYVARPLYDRFVEAAVALVRQYRMGDPEDPATTLGPLAHRKGAALVEQHVAEARAAGARVLTGGTPWRGRGYFCEPTVLTEVDHGMKVMWEETFGPAVGIMPVRDDAEAVRLMNDSPYGLTASVWTQDMDRATRADVGARRRHGLRQPLRLPRSPPALGRGQGQRQGLLALPPGLRPPDAPEELPPPDPHAPGLTAARRPDAGLTALRPPRLDSPVPTSPLRGPGRRP